MNKIIKKIYSTPFLIYAIIALIFAMILFIPIDPDFYWHLKYGQLTLTNGPISHDPFSYTFSEFRFYDYQWGSNVLMYLLYRIGGFYALALVYAIFVIGALVIAVNTPLSKKAPRSAKLIMILAGVLVIKSVIGIRPQVVSIPAITLLYYCITQFLRGRKKYLYAIPPLMLIWANLHPGFLSGLIMLVVVLWAEWIKVLVRPMLKLFEIKVANNITVTPIKALLLFTAVIFISIIATCITPFGYHILTQSIEFSMDSYAQEIIQEWLAPNTHRFSGLLAIGYTFLVAFSFYRRKNVGFSEVMILLAFGFMTLQTIRHIPLFVVISIPSLLRLKEWKVVDKIISEKNPILFLVHSTAFATSLLVGALLFADFLFTNSTQERVDQRSNRPYQAVNFIKKNNYSGNLFNNYGIGGYLIWAFPEEKVFIDGRMTSWTLDGERVLKIYDEISGFKVPRWQDELDNYEVNLLLLLKNEPMANALREVPEWRIVYEDNQSVVYVRTTKLKAKSQKEKNWGWKTLQLVQSPVESTNISI